MNTLHMPETKSARQGETQVLGVNITPMLKDDLTRYLMVSCLGERGKLVLNVNAHALNLAYSLPWFRSTLNASDVVFIDGYGVILAAWLLGYGHLPRITYADWMWDLAGFCVEHDISLYFLGARQGIAEQAAVNLLSQHPDLRILGTHHGYFDHSVHSNENQAVCAEINHLKPDLLFVGFGMPLQEKWLAENLGQLDVAAGLSCGALFDYVSNNLKRAPRFLTDHGLEWLGRLSYEPARLWRRYLLGNPVFLWRVFLQMVRRGPGVR
jgi:N-acetylglucosaminyldiphosphoundecaprenol N-acetyl-beta-D-mannosaminyltransferase